MSPNRVERSQNPVGAGGVGSDFAAAFSVPDGCDGCDGASVWDDVAAGVAWLVTCAKAGATTLTDNAAPRQPLGIEWHPVRVSALLKHETNASTNIGTPFP